MTNMYPYNALVPTTPCVFGCASMLNSRFAGVSVPRPTNLRKGAFCSLQLLRLRTMTIVPTDDAEAALA